MSLENVITHFAKWDKESEIMEFQTSSATVQEAADTLNVEPARIAKTLSFRKGDEGVLIVAAGDAKIDNKKFKTVFAEKPRMLTEEEVYRKTGHKVGGVCPFGLITDMDVYLDESLQRFSSVFPACGSSNSAIEVTCDELYLYGNGKGWVDVCKGWREE